MSIQTLRALRRFVTARDGATAIEYGLIGAIVSVVILVSVALIGDTLAGIFAQVVAGFGG